MRQPMRDHVPSALEGTVGLARFQAIPRDACRFLCGDLGEAVEGEAAAADGFEVLAGRLSAPSSAIRTTRRCRSGKRATLRSSTGGIGIRVGRPGRRTFAEVRSTPTDPGRRLSLGGK